MLQYMRDASVCLLTKSEEKDTLVKGTRVGEKKKNTLVRSKRVGNLIARKKEFCSQERTSEEGTISLVTIITA